VEMLFNIIQTGVIIGTLIVAIIVMRKSIKAQSGAILLEIDKVMHDLRPEWDKLYALDKVYTGWTDQDRILANKVGFELERVARLCMYGLINKRYVMDAYQGVFANCFDILKDYIKFYRVQNGEPGELKDGGFKRKHFEQFAKECKKQYEISKII